MTYYTSLNYYTRPYKIPVPEGQKNVDYTKLFKQDLKQGQVSEYIAYKQGLPVTRHLVEKYANNTPFGEVIGDTTSLGNVVFSCTDGTYDTKLDLSTLSRHFGLVKDLLDDGMLKKDEQGIITIPIQLTIQNISSALKGIYAEPRWMVTCKLPHYALLVLRPIDTSYYFRYQWYMKWDVLETDTTNLTHEEMYKFFVGISLGLDEDTRAYYSKYTRMCGAVIGPIVGYILRNPSFYGGHDLSSVALNDKPSVYLYIMCSISADVMGILKLVRTIQLTDNAEGLDMVDWGSIQKRLYLLLRDAYKLDCNTFHRIGAILGWITLEDFHCPMFEPYYICDDDLATWKARMSQ
jgi:hypothetical protein